MVLPLAQAADQGPTSLATDVCISFAPTQDVRRDGHEARHSSMFSCKGDGVAREMDTLEHLYSTKYCKAFSDEWACKMRLLLRCDTFAYYRDTVKGVKRKSSYFACWLN